MSKEVLAKIQQQILKPQTILFASIKQKIQKQAPKSQLAEVIDIFLTETYETLILTKRKLPQRFIKKLQTLSILSYFFNLNSYNLNTLCKQLNLTKDQCMTLLIEANIYKLVSVHIDEEHNNIIIRNSKNRQRQKQPESLILSQCKINMIHKKNENVLKSIQDLLILNKQKVNQNQSDYKSFYDMS